MDIGPDKIADGAPNAAPVAWLCLTKPTEDFVEERDGYGDQLGSSYCWDDTVPNHAKVIPGNMIALWNGKRLLGVSWVESVNVGAGIKTRRRCPLEECGDAHVMRRQNKQPTYKCAKCGHEFDRPTLEDVPVRVYRADYSAGWTPVNGIDAHACRRLALSFKNQQSIRAADPEAIRVLLGGLTTLQTARFSGRDALANGGHRVATVWTRVGQPQFRSTMFSIFSNTCAFTGRNHEAALEAAHLYRYADHKVHEREGGLLMRRDIHRLFDIGLICVNCETHLVDIHREIDEQPEYSSLHGKPLKVELTEKHWRWLNLHWRQFRGN